MKSKFGIIAVLILASAGFGQVTGGKDESVNRDPYAAEIVTSDIDLFWKAFEKATPDNDLIVYRDGYLRKGSTGLQEFLRLRIGSVCELADAIESHPAYYRQLKEQSLRIDSFKPQIRRSFAELKGIYPDAVFPSVYFVVGQMNSAGTLSEKGLLIGVEMFGRTDEMPLDELGNWHRAVLASVDRIPYIVAHELIHYQQGPSNDRTLLAAAIREGSADFIGELISGGQINPHLHDYGDPRERELWIEFKKEMTGTDRSNWLYQGDKSTVRPADLGYYIGYKIAESYYRKAADKRMAINEILRIEDFSEFLEKSGYGSKFAEAEE